MPIRTNAVDDDILVIIFLCNDPAQAADACVELLSAEGARHRGTVWRPADAEAPAA